MVGKSSILLWLAFRISAFAYNERFTSVKIVKVSRLIMSTKQKTDSRDNLDTAAATAKKKSYHERLFNFQVGNKIENARFGTL